MLNLYFAILDIIMNLTLVQMIEVLNYGVELSYVRKED